METKCDHQWVRDPDGDYCGACGIRWIDWTRGFDSNVRPFPKKPEPLVRPNA